MPYKDKEKRKASDKRYREKNKEKIKERGKVHYEANKEKKKAQMKAYFQTEKGKESQNRSSKKSQAKFPIKRKAGSKVNNAIRLGYLIKPKICSLCGCNDLKIEAHHWSYEEKNWLDVVWCCKQCHIDIHNNKTEDNKQ